ncbi:hypothetical protein BIT28_09525 [Photobacterium proteolyticum]|uniref:DUF2955 domain-containing protein n=1 Tax=Photobacterium proteolyticum TaxID=1903952 RepID=A0A1Q9H1J8_9GAMM|nr:DUF2955 domain-containing protein [Photobacterium proteolyticum]OLQ81603.1 hypothetical protein BIT28_09525 [Photobacterium proteolyticum]
MSTDSVGASVAVNSNRENERNILRYSLGVMIPVFVMVMWQWEMAYITPSLVTLMLGPPARPFPPRVYGGFIKALIVALGMGIFLTRIVEPYPLLTVIAMGWFLYGIFYKAATGANILIVVILLMSVLAYPSMAMLDINLSMEIALGVTKSYLLALFSTALMHVIIPVKVSNPSPSPTIKSPAEAARTALINTLVVLPILVYFLMFDCQAAILTLIYVGILVLSACLHKGIKTLVGVLIANFIGGLAAIAIYELMVIAPVVPFYLLIMFLGTLMFAKIVFNSPKGALFASALSCVMLLITDTTNTTGFDLDYAFYERWIYIALANIYVVFNFMVLTALGWLKPSTKP